MSKSDKIALMNDTKWDEIRLAMYNIDPPPKWRTLDGENQHLSEWDAEWFYHFRDGAYSTIEWLEIQCADDDQHRSVKEALARIHVPGTLTDAGFKVFGYGESGAFYDYIGDA